MTNKTLILVVLIMAVLIIAGSCATGKKAFVAKENEELYGTWVNKEYNNKGMYYAKHIINADGTINLYTFDYSTRVYENDKYIITDKWYDTIGNIWYKAIITERASSAVKTTNPIYTLAKISNAGKILETVKSGYDYPTELDPDTLLYNYEILYRQE